MDYLTQSKTFLHRAKDANDASEKEAHLSMAIQMLEKAIAAAERAGDTLTASRSKGSVDARP